jgi:Fe-S cluster assembly iron-binding protein IscA
LNKVGYFFSGIVAENNICFLATVDYLEDLQGARFIIHNPNAKTTCGCGSSFSV